MPVQIGQGSGKVVFGQGGEIRPRADGVKLKCHIQPRPLLMTAFAQHLCRQPGQRLLCQAVAVIGLETAKLSQT